MRRAFLRAVRLVRSPNEEWRVIASEKPDTLALLGGFVLPLSCIPAACRALGLGLSGNNGAVGRDGIAFGAHEIARGGVSVLLGVVLSIVLLAGSMHALVPLFGRPRDWPRALQVAAYSAAPVLLAGIVLILPDLAFALMIAAVHGLYLLYGGASRVLGVKVDDAAEYLALVMVMFIVASMVVGALCSSMGVM